MLDSLGAASSFAGVFPSVELLSAAGASASELLSAAGVSLFSDGFAAASPSAGESPSAGSVALPSLVSAGTSKGRSSLTVRSDQSAGNSSSGIGGNVIGDGESKRHTDADHQAHVLRITFKNIWVTVQGHTVHWRCSRYYLLLLSKNSIILVLYLIY